MESHKESTIESALRAGVEAKGGLCLKFTSIGRRGAPDRIIVMPGGRIDFIETKAPRGVLKPWQARFHEDLRERGQTVHVLYTIGQVEWFVSML